LEGNITENEMSATNSLKESSGKKTKCAVSSNRHDMDSSMGGKREAAGGGMVKEENNQVVNANANIIIRKRKVSEDATLSKQEKASKSKRKIERCQAEDEMAKKDAKQNEKKKRKKERKASDSHLAVPTGIDVSDLIHHEANVDNGTDMHTMNAREKHEHETWNKRFVELVKYEQKNGHCNVPTRNGSFWHWILKQRALFRSKKLKADRYEKLVGIGFEFPKSDHEKWNILFVELVEYKQKNGHCNVPTRNGSFGLWVSRQRTLFRSKKLKEGRYEKLVGIGFA
jgi:hypothetical protein